jgi:quinol---cytochrome c reductase iron-sulfur subunit, bacillus type
MNRRNMLAWLSRALQTCVAGAVVIPGLRYILPGLRTSRSGAGTFQRVARLQDLRPGQPLQVTIVGRKQDGWSVADSQVLGRVWLIRDADGNDSKIKAFTTVCPHMGCQIQLHPKGAGFVCPCHRATFGMAGSPLPASQTGERNHAPRAMDALECHVVRNDASGESWIEVKYEKFEPGLTKKVARG